ncbi:MAG TPA: hypothetical protein VML75_04355 [Kofleriaceae bacterium]|nr:hypothetical protein [Kofleriaceae bacterium]
MTYGYDRPVRRVEPGSFEATSHYYERVLNAQIHPMVGAFLALGNDRVAERYCHLHPEVEPNAVRERLSHQPKLFQWGGADLFPTTTEDGIRQLVVIETNSCPSGQKSMPQVLEHHEQVGYRVLLEQAFMPQLRSKRKLPPGGLAVLYDKNLMEASGYAATLADLAGERVYLTPCFDGDPSPRARFDESGVLEVLDGNEWVPIRAAMRYVTQRPWNRIPTITRTFIMNPVLVCLAGGRNKMLAAKAYDLYNGKLARTGLRLRTPQTMWEITKEQIPMWVERMGGLAVIKVPYSNAGQGVTTITSDAELEDFMKLEHHYDRFVVQALIGNNKWSSRTNQGRLYHVGTVPNGKLNMYAADLRLMVGGGLEGFFPVAIYARRARMPLAPSLESGEASWSMLGTNLSVKNPDGSWATETERLMLMDSRDFNRIGIGIDDLIEAYIQTVLAVTSIDEMAQTLISTKGRFRRRFFGAMNPDPALLGEIL